MFANDQDFISTVPLDVLAKLIMGSASHDKFNLAQSNGLLKVFRMARLFKILRLVKMSKIIKVRRGHAFG